MRAFVNGSGRRTKLRGHQSCEGALLDSCHQWIVSPLSSRRNPDRRLRQETDARPTEFTIGMDRRGDLHTGNVRRGRRHVCCLACRARCRRAAHLPDTRVQRSAPLAVLFAAPATT
jgi:hypothetical protein